MWYSGFVSAKIITIIAMNISKEETIKALVKASVESYAEGFQARHLAEFENPDGVINMKIHNVFISALGVDISYYSALARSLDSSLGKMLEKLAINIAQLSFVVDQKVDGPLTLQQTQQIAEILERYNRHEKKPEVVDYMFLREKPTNRDLKRKIHKSDYYLTNKATNERFLIELKIGGDLDNKKARSEKEAILEQYAILSNTLGPSSKITIYFATAYNRFGEDKPWTQTRVKQFFADEELLIGRDFWNFVCQSDKGYPWVIEAYKESAHLIKAGLDAIKSAYLS